MSIKAFRHKTFEERLAEYNGEITIEPFEWGAPEGRKMLFVDPAARGISVSDRISCADKMEISDTLQSMFEYD